MNWNELVVLCIGTMRVRGDSLGPLVGSHLCRMRLPGVHIYGTTDAPVHALNLEETIQSIRLCHPGIPVLAVDAASGPFRFLGRIVSGNGPIKPGAGLDKELPPVGDAHITGVLGIAGPLSLLSLHLASKRKVQKMARTVSDRIIETFTNA